MDKLNLQVLFLPGIPSTHKQYLVLQDFRKAGATIYYHSYPGFDKRSDQSFSVSACIESVKKELQKMTANNKPFVVIAYSFSTYILNQIEPTLLKKCEAILLFSPIQSLETKHIKNDFFELINQLHQSKKINANLKKSKNELQNHPNNKDTLGWFKGMKDVEVPLLISYSKNDPSKYSQNFIDKIQAINKEKPYLGLFATSHGKHNIDSYYNNLARLTVILTLAKIYTASQLAEIELSIYCWGSLLNPQLISKQSDIDILLIGNVSVDYYKTLHNISDYFSTNYEVKVSFSINRVEDFNKILIRRNRKYIFLHELFYDYIRLSKENIQVAPPPFSSVKNEASLVLCSLENEINKQLQQYYKKPNSTSYIVKQTIQAYRMHLYKNNNKKVDYKSMIDNLGKKQNMTIKHGVELALDLKVNLPKQASFDELCIIASAVKEISELADEK